MKLKEVKGNVIFDNAGSIRYGEARLVVRVSKSKGFKSLSITDERLGLMYQISLNDIEELL